MLGQASQCVKIGLDPRLLPPIHVVMNLLQQAFEYAAGNRIVVRWQNDHLADHNPIFLVP